MCPMSTYTEGIEKRKQSRELHLEERKAHEREEPNTGVHMSEKKAVKSSSSTCCQSTVPLPAASASCGNVLGFQVLRPHPDLLKQKLGEMCRGSRNLRRSTANGPGTRQSLRTAFQSAKRKSYYINLETKVSTNETRVSK